MQVGVPVQPRNRLLRSLSPETLSGLKPQLKLVQLKAHRVLQHSRLPIEVVFFIEDGLVSVDAATDDDSPLAEAWMVGTEGMAGLAIVLGENSSPHTRVVEVAGCAWAMKSPDLVRAMDEIPEFRRVMLRYVHSVLVQTAQTSACNARHPLRGRLARTLLMIQDRLGRRDIPLTHDRIAKLLGVRRASITTGLSELQSAGAIRIERSQITVADRPKLQSVTCYCYSVLKSYHLRHLSDAPAAEAS